MLASITPLGERGRQSHWVLTVTAFLIGASAAGAAVGVLAGWGGSLAGRVSADARLGVLAVAAVVALAVEAGPSRIPGPRRQVDERWRDRYRGWVWGLGYGVQLGVGVSTIVASSATYLALVAAVLSGSPGLGALIVGVHGAVRGATPLAAAGVHRPDQLRALHRRLEHRRLAAARGAYLGLAAIAALAAIGTVA